MRFILQHLAPMAAMAAAALLAAPAQAAAPAEADTAGPAPRPAPSGPAAVTAPRDTAALYQAACASCHGSDGTGVSQTQVGFDVPLPDFTDCSFASREPDTDWLAVTHSGGPARGFDELMPAFGDALTLEEIQQTVDHLRSFCEDDAWPRGELNLPKALFTEKAYPEDEFYVRAGGDVEGAGNVSSRLVFEKRFGPRNQLEIAVPFSFIEAPAGGADAGSWQSGIGDVALGFKRVLLASLASGSIASVTAEVVMATGDASRGLGKGTAVFEPFVTYGQIIPVLGFLQFQGGLELPFDTTIAENEWFARLVFGHDFNTGLWGRTFSPMVGVLTGGELSESPAPSWDLVPQMLITLNTRQNIMLNVGVRLPLTDADERDTAVYALFLWDWFDGGLFEGW